MAERTMSPIAEIARGRDVDPAASMSLHADASTQGARLECERRAVFGRTWQWSCHTEKLRWAGSYVAGEVAGMPTRCCRSKTSASSRACSAG